MPRHSATQKPRAHELPDAETHSEGFRHVREARRSVGPARRRWPQRVTLSLADQLVQAWSDLPRVAQRSLSALLVVALLGLVLVPALRLGGDRDPRSFSMPELVAYGSADFPPGPATVTTLGELPHRRGKALIVRVPPRRGLDPALLDPTGAALPLRVRAVDANELRTLVAYSREGDVHVLSVYDLEAKLRVARYVLDGWPDFSFGERGRIDAGQLVKLMPEAR